MTDDDRRAIRSILRAIIIAILLHLAYSALTADDTMTIHTDYSSNDHRPPLDIAPLPRYDDPMINHATIANIDADLCRLIGVERVRLRALTRSRGRWYDGVMTDHDEEYCTLHAQDGNECERLDNEGERGNPPYELCRRWRWEMYIRGDLPETIVDAAREHFGNMN